MPTRVTEFESRSRLEFARVVAGADVDLARSALLIACEEYPDLDVPRYLSQLDDLGATARAHVQDLPAPDRVDRLTRYLFHEQGFQGNTEDYYDPRNSFLNDVLDRRLGIPITLSTVLIEVGRRAGVAVTGVGLPGHFIVKAAGAAGDVLIDPFHGGVQLTERDCQERLDAVYGGRLRMAEHMLAPCGPKYMLERMLRNLRAIYAARNDPLRALGVVDLLLRVAPDNPEDLRDRGLLYAALDCYGLAAADLEAFVRRAPSSPQADELARTAAEMRRRLARSN